MEENQYRYIMNYLSEILLIILSNDIIYELTKIYCLRLKKKTDTKDEQVVKTKKMVEWWLRVFVLNVVL